MSEGLAYSDLGDFPPCLICGDGADEQARLVRRLRYHELLAQDPNADFMNEFCDLCWDEFNLEDGND